LSFERLPVDRANQIEQSVVERPSANHLEIDSTIKSLDHFENLGSATIDY
jgi:hypothetical protein